MGDLNDDKLRELGEKLAVFAEDAPVQWPVAPFQMHPVPEFMPSSAALLQAQQQHFLQQIGSYSGSYYPAPAVAAVPPPVLSFQHLQHHVHQTSQQPLFAASTQTEALSFLAPAVKDAASSPKHQRVPSLGAIDSETNPIAASLLMSFKSIISDDRAASKPDHPTLQPVQTHVKRERQGGNSNGHHQGDGHHNGKQHHVLLRPHFYANDFNNGIQTQQTTQSLPPPPPPPVQLEQQCDSWSPYSGSMCGVGDQGGVSSRPKFSDVVKKSLNEVAAGNNLNQSASGNTQSLSRPVTPAPGPSQGAQTGPNGSTVTNVPPSPSLGQVVQGGGNSLQNANFSLASSRSNLSRNGKPIVVAKVEPMQVTANRLAASQQQQTAANKTVADTAAFTGKVRRTRSSTTGNSGPMGGVSGGEAGNGGQSPGNFGGSIDSVFDTSSNTNKTSGNTKGDGSKRSGHGRMTTTSSMESHDSERDEEGRRVDDEDEGEPFDVQDDTTDDLAGGEVEDGVDQLESMLRHRSNTSQRHQASKTKKNTQKRGVKAAEAGSSRPALFFLKLGAFLAQLGPWIVFLLAKTGSLFRFMLYLVVQGLGYVFEVIFDAMKTCYEAVRRLFPAKVERAELKLSYLALLRQYGLPRPISLPASADATLKRLIQLSEADAYTVLGCRYDAKQDDINVRLRQLARLLTQNHKKTQQLEEAGAVFRRICNDIGSREARQRYDCELVAAAEFALKRRAAQMNSQHRHQFDQFSSSLGIGGLLAFQCYDCGLVHQFYEVPDRRQLEARACNRCGPSVLHPCDLNDLWAESLATGEADLVNGVGGGLADQHIRYMTCLLDCAVIYDATDAMPCCKSRFLSKFKLDPNCHAVAFKMELAPKIDEQGLPMRKLPNPTALQQADTEYWSTLQVYQVRMVAKFKHDNNSNFANSKQQQFDSPSSGSSGAARRRKGAK